MEKLTWYEATKYLTDYNKKYGIKTKGTTDHICKMVAVISEDSFTQAYSLEERSYIFTNDNKAFLPEMGGYSIFANSMDGSDTGVRLERYVEEASADRWKVDYCYILSED